MHTIANKPKVNSCGNFSRTTQIHNNTKPWKNNKTKDLTFKEISYHICTKLHIFFKDKELDLLFQQAKLKVTKRYPEGQKLFVVVYSLKYTAWSCLCLCLCLFKGRDVIKFYKYVALGKSPNLSKRRAFSPSKIFLFFHALKFYSFLRGKPQIFNKTIYTDSKNSRYHMMPFCLTNVCICSQRV